MIHKIEIPLTVLKNITSTHRLKMDGCPCPPFLCKFVNKRTVGRLFLCVLHPISPLDITPISDGNINIFLKNGLCCVSITVRQQPLPLTLCSAFTGDRRAGGERWQSLWSSGQRCPRQPRWGISWPQLPDGCHWPFHLSCNRHPSHRCARRLSFGSSRRNFTRWLTRSWQIPFQRWAYLTPLFAWCLNVWFSWFVCLKPSVQTPQRSRTPTPIPGLQAQVATQLSLSSSSSFLTTDMQDLYS